MNTFHCGNEQYVIDCNGVVKQLYPKPFPYDAAYSAIYDSEQYVKGNEKLQALRLGFMTGVLGTGARAYSILDCGYGNGAFMKATREYYPKVHGYDITGVPVPAGCIKLDALPFQTKEDLKVRSNVVTFWDCLEHFPDISFLARPDNVAYIFISLPNAWMFENFYSNFYGNKNMFELWPHRKPNEHLHHFNEGSLNATMEMYGWKMVAANYFEDIVRKSTRFHESRNNILTAAFTRK